MSHDHENIATEADHQPPISESWLSRHAPYILLLTFLFYCTQIAMEIFPYRFGLFEMLPIIEGSLLVLMAAALLGVASRVVGQVVRRAPAIAILKDILRAG